MKVKLKEIEIENLELINTGVRDPAREGVWDVYKSMSPTDHYIVHVVWNDGRISGIRIFED